MTQNPYAQFGGAGGGGSMPPGYPMDMQDQRTSALAVSSLVFSLICCIPGFGALGAILGGAGLIAINSSRGRLRGAGMAVTGIVLGLVITVLWVFVCLGMMTVMKGAAGVMLEPTSSAMTALEKGDNKGFRKLLSANANQLVTEQQIDAFRTTYRASNGEFVRTPDSFVDYFKAFFNVGQAMNNLNTQQHTGVVPIPAEFKNGWGVLLLEMPQFRSGSQSPTFNGVIENVGIVDQSGREVWLLPMPGSTAPAPPTPPSAPASPAEKPADAPSPPVPKP